MVAPTAAPPLIRRHRPSVPPAIASLRPVWSKPAALRAVRATIVVPALFTLTYKVVGDIQMATFAAFGGFATLVLASFGGDRRSKLTAHVLLGVVGSVLLVIGTAVTSTTALAVAVSVPVVFLVLFAGIAGPNAASGGTAALLAYVLPAASPGAVSMIPSRLAGWWLATAAGTIAVMLLSPRPASDRVRAAAADCATAVARTLDAALTGRPADEESRAALDAKHTLMDTFASTPYRPTGLARADQALDNLVETLEWCTALVVDLVREGTDLSTVAPVDAELLRVSARALQEVATLIGGGPGALDPDALEKLQDASAARVAELRQDATCTERAVHVSFHARIVAAAVRIALVNARAGVDQPVKGRRSALESVLRNARRLAGSHTSLQSVWFVNSVRGAVALAAATAVADLVHVQHGFWVVLGTMSVLRTNAASTGSTALRAVLGTAAGFFIGGALIVAIGHHTSVMWAALPVAILVASYAPGTAPFAVGQAAFTVTVSVLYNILVPVGWKVGVLRIEDVAIGAAVSAVVGIVFWPRGAGAVVANDLAAAFRSGGLYLVQATSWAVGSRPAPPDAEPQALAAAVRLDDGLRGFLAEQGAKHVSKDHVWRLVGAALRIRLTARSLASVPAPDSVHDPARLALVQEATRLAGWCDGIASELARTSTTAAQELATAISDELAPSHPQGGYLLWVMHHLEHVRDHLADLVDPVSTVAAARALPWWR